MSSVSTMSSADLWGRYKKYLCTCPSVGLTLDISRMNFPDDFFTANAGRINQAFAAMDKLEAGAIANQDEKRMVGHYWLRDASRAPTAEIRAEITDTLAAIKAFAADVHAGKIASPTGQKFTQVLVIGIGGGALGPQFVADALGTGAGGGDKMTPFFFDNTDPDGMDRVLLLAGGPLGKKLAETLSVVISKSGGTKETRNGMLIAQRAYQAAGLDFGRHVVAVTGDGSDLDKVAVAGKWLKRFPMWDWVGGRTSELSAVGLLPAALQGLNIDAMLEGARDIDQITRLYGTMQNPAALLALMWFHAEGGGSASGTGMGQKAMVVLPYKDRLVLFSKYLQQLVMESLGKELDRQGRVVHQGINVFGNKGSTDQHAYVQQLRDGVNNFFVTFIEVLADRSFITQNAPESSAALAVEPDVTSGDYLNGFFQGTRTALAGSGRESMTISIKEVSPRAIGVLIALFERAVGLYGELVDINAYHQPGVEAGKKAATAVIAVQLKVLAYLRGGKSGTAEQIAAGAGLGAEVETVYHVLRHLAANPEHKVAASGGDGVEAVYGG